MVYEHILTEDEDFKDNVINLKRTNWMNSLVRLTTTDIKVDNNKDIENK